MSLFLIDYIKMFLLSRNMSSPNFSDITEATSIPVCEPSISTNSNRDNYENTNNEGIYFSC